MAFQSSKRLDMDLVKAQQLIFDLEMVSFPKLVRFGLTEYCLNKISENDIVEAVKDTCNQNITPIQMIYSKFQDTFKIFGMKN
ncbi:unnamed protein product [Rhizophagus irregularis]|nr:unnamed protein product [Rhizophagus irregularis]